MCPLQHSREKQPRISLLRHSGDHCLRTKVSTTSFINRVGEPTNFCCTPGLSKLKRWKEDVLHPVTNRETEAANHHQIPIRKTTLGSPCGPHILPKVSPVPFQAGRFLFDGVWFLWIPLLTVAGLLPLQKEGLLPASVLSLLLFTPKAWMHRSEDTQKGSNRPTSCTPRATPCSSTPMVILESHF